MTLEGADNPLSIGRENSFKIVAFVEKNTANSLTVA